MCLAKAYSGKDAEEVILQDVTRIQIDGDRIRMEDMFGEEKIVMGSVLEVDFEKSRVILKPFQGKQ
jgi:predicted RNA-binding protein